MNQQKRVVDAIKHSGVKRIAIVDDAFDPPSLVDDDWPGVLGLLTAANASSIREDAGIPPALWQGAIDAINSGSYGDDELLECVDKIYAAYVATFDAKFDPAKKFETTKGTNLGNIRPLISLIRSCNPEIEILTFGSAGEMNGDEGAHVVFVDLFLDARIGATTDPTAAVAGSAVEASLERIKPLMALSPSVILMSSHADRAEVVDYRSKIAGGAVYASRFAFIEKTKITLTQEQGEVYVAHEAGDALLDIFQSYKFGRGLHDALKGWVDSAKGAVEQLAAELQSLELKDISYLVRFRLAAEGQNLPEYLEWLLTECLVDELGKQMDRQPRLDSYKYLAPDEAAKIEGAFEGPTERVADLYHRVRIENRRENGRQHFRLGDLYLRKDPSGEHLLAVMNPDCDLVTRPNGTRAAGMLFTVRGELQDFDAPQTSVGDFIIVGKRPRNIRWNYRDIETLGFTNALASPGQSLGAYTYLGALRPLYAQEIQANLLNQMGRVGVAVPPALAFAASVRAAYVDKDGKQVEVAIDGGNETLCYLVPPRQSGQIGQAVFKRKFVRDFLSAMSSVDVATLGQDAAKLLAKLRAPNAEAKLIKMTSSGVRLDDSIEFGVFLTAQEKRPSSKPWCWLTVSVAKVLAEISPSIVSAAIRDDAALDDGSDEALGPSATPGAEGPHVEPMAAPAADQKAGEQK
jgi:hypothetical protein